MGDGADVEVAAGHNEGQIDGQQRPS